MNNHCSRNIYIIKISCIVLFLFASAIAEAQNGLALTVTDFLNWQPATANPTNISSVAVKNRVKSPNLQAITGIDTNARILYCPDGMNNFGPYIDSASQFNLFNFSHWQYIDILAWFGGSASSPIILPTKSWVDCAHKNGVKVIGTIFMAPTVYGGTQAQMQSFLVQDSTGQFPAAHQLKAIADYYNFDGWIFNFETQVNSATGALASAFIAELDSIYTGETIWYDAMLQSGTVSYQNKLDASNAFFFEHTSGIFTNYNWGSANTVASSATYATSVGRSPFDVYTGADMWPSRTAQPAFTNYTWIDKIFPSGIAKTSVALFATNFTFNYAPFSTFNTDSTAYESFYQTEDKLFYGIDLDPFAVDATWKGIGNYVAVRTPITSLPFETDFNTGHGLNYYYNGSALNTGSWSNIAHQSNLPTWKTVNSNLTMSYNFTDAYNGGSSLFINGTGNGNHIISLYSSDMETNANSLLMELAVDSAINVDSIGIELQMSNVSASIITYFHPSVNAGWEDLINSAVAVGTNDTIVAIHLLIHSAGAYSINIGKININENLTGLLSLADNLKSTFAVYPNPSDGIVSVVNTGNSKGQLTIYDLTGKCVMNKSLSAGETNEVKLQSSAVYLYDFISDKITNQGKIIIR